MCQGSHDHEYSAPGSALSRRRLEGESLTNTLPHPSNTIPGHFSRAAALRNHTNQRKLNKCVRDALRRTSIGFFVVDACYKGGIDIQIFTYQSFLKIKMPRVTEFHVGRETDEQMTLTVWTGTCRPIDENTHDKLDQFHCCLNFQKTKRSFQVSGIPNEDSPPKLVYRPTKMSRLKKCKSSRTCLSK